MNILVVVDMQNDFIDGVLGTPEAVAIVSKVAEKIREYESHDAVIIYTRDTHFRDYLDTIEGQNLPVPHCVFGTQGWNISEALDADLTYCINKTTFGSMELPNYIDSIVNREEIDSIEIVGLCTDICVISNAMILKAAYENTHIVVDSTCCAGVTPESHTNALKAMEMCHIRVV